MRITSQMCVLPVSRQGQAMPLSLHAEEQSLFHVDSQVASEHQSAAFDYFSEDLLCFEEVAWIADSKGLRSSCKQRAGVTPPHTCYAFIRLPPQLPLRFDGRAGNRRQHAPQQLHSRVLYKASVELSVTINQLQGEAITIDLVSPVFFTAFRQRINFAYLVQAEGSFATTHLQTEHSVAVVAQWRGQATAPNSFYFPNSTQNEGRNELYASTACSVLSSLPVIRAAQVPQGSIATSRQEHATCLHPHSFFTIRQACPSSILYS
jgi:hypothetical protein